MPTNNYPGIGKKTQGKDFNYFQKFTVVATDFGSESIDGYQPDAIITFSTQAIMMLNEETAGVVEYSFNGTTVHGELDGAGSTKGLAFDNRVVSTIWLRIKSGSSAPIVVSIHAWGIR